MIKRIIAVILFILIGIFLVDISVSIIKFGEFGYTCILFGLAYFFGAVCGMMISEEG